MSPWSWPFSLLCRLIVKILGWTIILEYKPFRKKFVTIAGPHTSHWDLALTLMAFWAFRMPLRIAVKKEVFDVFLLGPLVRALGGLAIDRETSHNYTDELAQFIGASEEIALAIAPSGTRSPRPYWRTGFYFVAIKAECPIVLGFLDWQRKEMGLGKVLIPSGDLDRDFAIIREFYADKSPRFPEKVTPIRHRGEIGEPFAVER